MISDIANDLLRQAIKKDRELARREAFLEACRVICIGCAEGIDMALFELSTEPPLLNFYHQIDRCGHAYCGATEIKRKIKNELQRT